MNATLRDRVIALANERYGTEEEHFSVQFPSYVLLRNTNRKWYGIIMDVPKSTLGLPGEEKVDAINLKCEPLLIGSLRQQPGILPGYHCNKDHWITVLLDGTVDLEQISILLDISHQLTGPKKTTKRHKKAEQ